MEVDGEAGDMGQNRQCHTKPWQVESEKSLRERDEATETLARAMIWGMTKDFWRDATGVHSDVCGLKFSPASGFQ